MLLCGVATQCEIQDHVVWDTGRVQVCAAFAMCVPVAREQMQKCEARGNGSTYPPGPVDKSSIPATMHAHRHAQFVMT